MGRNANLPLYQRRFDDAPDVDETTARDEYRNCLAYLDQILSEPDADAYLDSDPRDNFERNVTELHGHKLLFEAPHSDISNFTLRWPDADITFISVREPLPDEYYDAHTDPNLNHYTTFVLDFSPYGDSPAESETGNTDHNWETVNERHVYTGTRYGFGA